MTRKIKSFWRNIIDSNNSSSSKRLITLLISLHFVLASFAILFLVCYVVMYLPKGRVEPTLLDSLGKVLEYDFYIILSGLGFITSEGVVKMFVTKNTQLPPYDQYNQNSYNPNQYNQNQYNQVDPSTVPPGETETTP